MITKTFLTAGDAIFTIQEPDGVKHYTFRIERVEANDRWPESYFVKVLTGPDNTSDYTYFGKLDTSTGQVSTTTKSARWKETRHLLVLNRVLARIWCDDQAAYEQHGWKVHHEGRCGRCGRLLTVPGPAMFSTKQFTWHKASQTFTAFASDLEVTSPGRTFILKSHVTGREVTFLHSSTERDREDEIIRWLYASDEVPGVKVLIYND